MNQHKLSASADILLKNERINSPTNYNLSTEVGEQFPPSSYRWIFN